MSWKNIIIASFVVIGLFGLSRLTSPADAAEDPTLPFAPSGYVLGDEIEDYARFMMSGGPGHRLCP